VSLVTAAMLRGILSAYSTTASPTESLIPSVENKYSKARIYAFSFFLEVCNG
jgi:hypothetical protein